MRILVLGAEGMLGASVMKEFPGAFGTTKGTASTPGVRGGVDISNEKDLRVAFDWVKPDVIINCAGIVKSECDRHDPKYVAAVNARAPHVIEMLAGDRRVVHVSTDCVFDGTRGARKESDAPDATDLYGITKAAGEIASWNCVTLRTSFIGRDRVRKRGLLEWLLAQTREVIGYNRMMWSGLSADELARVIKKVAIERDDLYGLFHVSGPLISKADLLLELMRAYGMENRLYRNDEIQIDRSLDGSKFRDATGYVPPTWTEMAKELRGG